MTARDKLEAEAREWITEFDGSFQRDQDSLVVDIRSLADWAERLVRDAVAPAAGALRDLLRDIDARFQLDQGFKGMGHNILTESAGRIRVDAEYARKVLAALDAREASQGSEGPMLDSPNSRPKGLDEFVARGFERKHRHD